MVDRAILKEENPIGWAISAAKKDASYLISPRARASALEILRDVDSLEASAARIILEDGGAQQGTEEHVKRGFVSLSAWRNAADVLGVFDDE